MERTSGGRAEAGGNTERAIFDSQLSEEQQR